MTIPPLDSPGNWPEDFDQPNGNYIVKCRECTQFFHGHKRRMYCKICQELVTEQIESRNWWAI